MKFIELTFRNEEKTFVNVDLINRFNISCNGYTYIHFDGKGFVEVKETPERILKMIETAKQGGFLLGERMNKEQAKHELAELHEKERILEKALEIVREKIRELVNYTDKNKVQK